jgi:hypothetical protein
MPAHAAAPRPVEVCDVECSFGEFVGVSVTDREVVETETVTDMEPAVDVVGDVEEDDEDDNAVVELEPVVSAPCASVMLK